MMKSVKLLVKYNSEKLGIKSEISDGEAEVEGEIDDGVLIENQLTPLELQYFFPVAWLEEIYLWLTSKYDVKSDLDLDNIMEKEILKYLLTRQVLPNATVLDRKHIESLDGLREYNEHDQVGSFRMSKSEGIKIYLTIMLRKEEAITFVGFLGGRRVTGCGERQSTFLRTKFGKDFDLSSVKVEYSLTDSKAKTNSYLEVIRQLENLPIPEVKSRLLLIFCSEICRNFIGIKLSEIPVMANHGASGLSGGVVDISIGSESPKDWRIVQCFLHALFVNVVCLNGSEVLRNKKAEKIWAKKIEFLDIVDRALDKSLPKYSRLKACKELEAFREGQEMIDGWEKYVYNDIGFWLDRTLTDVYEKCFVEKSPPSINSICSSCNNSIVSAYMEMTGKELDFKELANFKANSISVYVDNNSSVTIRTLRTPDLYHQYY